jgi:hypothetical protein
LNEFSSFVFSIANCFRLQMKTIFLNAFKWGKQKNI